MEEYSTPIRGMVGLVVPEVGLFGTVCHLKQSP